MNDQISQRRWDQDDLAKAARVSQATISRVMAGVREPTADLCIKLAAALGLPPVMVLEIGNVLPPPPGDPAVGYIYDLVKLMDSETRREVLEYAIWQYRRRSGNSTSGDAQNPRNQLESPDEAKPI
jgi:transcriptional regulator with XRE-family HTH domain